jgi:hypothetical protein
MSLCVSLRYVCFIISPLTSARFHRVPDSLSGH